MQQLYTEMDLDAGTLTAYHFGMEKVAKVSELRRKRKSAKMTQLQLAERVGTSQPQIRRLESDQREMTGDWALRISPHVPDTIPEDLVFGALTVPIVGYVAAGRAFFEPAYLGLARRPRGATDSTVAVEIRGDSAGPGFNGHITYYNNRREPPTDIIERHQYYVVGLASSEILLKRLVRRGTVFDLYSGDQTEPPIMDQIVEWAAPIFGTSPPGMAKVEESQEEPPPPPPPKSGNARRGPKAATRARRRR